ncbi:MAG: nucleoside monophosphate kinase, partial [Anaerotignum sp.]|nr:nucleoside monophosphate kinase [Anaerotignum sp.]
AKSIMASGGLVSDELIIAIVKERIQKDDCKNGFILDGFPRTVVQAEKLDEMVALDKVAYINAPDEIMLARLTARETCSKCGATYNKLFLPAKVAGVCDACGEALTQRKDDTTEAGLARIKTFHEQSEPLVAFYDKKGILFEVDGTLPIDDITKAIIEGLER